MIGRTTRRALLAAGTAAAALTIAAPAAFAHIGLDKSEVTAGSRTSLTFGFGHGCEDSPTNRMAIEIPEGVNNAQPFMKAGWDIEVTMAELAEPLESTHGEAQTERVSVVTFTAQDGFATPSEFRDSVTLSFTAPEAEGQLFFKVVQGCEEGENPWIEEWDGTGEEPDYPAPSVNVVAAEEGEGDGHGGGETTATTVAVGDESGDSDDSGSSNGLAIAGLVAGLVGLGAGGTALLRSSGNKPEGV